MTHKSRPTLSETYRHQNQYIGGTLCHVWEEPRRGRGVLGGPLCTGVDGVSIDGLQIALTTDTVQKYLETKVYPWYYTVVVVLLLLYQAVMWPRM